MSLDLILTKEIKSKGAILIKKGILWRKYRNLAAEKKWDEAEKIMWQIDILNKTVEV